MLRKNTSFSSTSQDTGFFDIVIGNPPYIDSETMINIGLESERKYIIDTYKYISGNWDIYLAFLEKGLDLSRDLLCYITPDKWLSRPFGLKFREQCMLSKMFEIVHVGSKIFENVRVDGIISLFNQKSEKITALRFIEDKKVKAINVLPKKELPPPYLIDFLFSENLNIIRKIEKSSTNLLSDFSMCENACATNDAYKLVSLIKNESSFDREKYFTLVNTGTIDKYSNKWGIKEITYLGEKYLYPIVNRKKFNGTFGKSYVLKANKPKIILKGLNLLNACIDFNGSVLPGKTTLIICNEDIKLLKILCAVVNSKLATFYIKNKYSSSSYCGGITFTKEMLNNFPLPDTIIQQSIVNHVEQILNKRKENPQADIIEHENAINEIMYKLYNLTKDEINIIES